MADFDYLMEVLTDAYCNMSGRDKDAWSMEKAENWLHDQRLYEERSGAEPIECDAQTVYEVIRDLIEEYGEGCDEDA